MMVKRIALGLCMVILVASIAAAQTDNESDLFVKTIYLERVYPHQLGYMVTYLGQNLRLQRLYIPMDWFGIAAGRARLIYGTDRAYPYMDVFWENGEFSHLRLYVVRDLRDMSWGAIDQTEDLSEEFAVESLELRL